MEYFLADLIEKIVGGLLFFAGLSLLIQTRYWIGLIQWMLALEKKSLIHLSLMLSYIFLPFSLVIVIIHNIWQWNAGLIVTLIGWVSLIKMLSLLIYPQSVLWMMKIYANKSDDFLKKFFTGFGLLYALLAFWILFAAD